jgi:hypothetical protein
MVPAPGFWLQPVEDTVFARNQESTVLLSDSEGASPLAAHLGPGAEPAECYGSVAELLSQQPLSSIAVLVLHFHPLPKGSVLATLGRMSVEYPAIQKVAVLGAPPPLPIAEYLTSCGVDILVDGPAEKVAEQLARIVNRMRERTRWIAS